uniref:ZP domain-containing protein n=1 Tax=Panagrellus redivivus TaxID=6233 RepID=A0A7E4ZQD1_PANRE
MLHRFSVYFGALFDKCRRRQRPEERTSHDEPASMPLVELPSTSAPIQSFIITRLVGPTKLPLNYWAKESVTVEGQLICCNDYGTVCLPTPFVNVAIYDRKIFTTPNLITETISNETGHFKISATTHVFYELRPMLAISHDCRMTKPSTPLMHWFKESFYEIPRDYVSKEGAVFGDGVYRLYPLMLHVPGVMEYEDMHCVFYECVPDNLDPQKVKEQTRIYADHNIFINALSSISTNRSTL